MPCHISLISLSAHFRSTLFALAMCGFMHFAKHLLHIHLVCEKVAEQEAERTFLTSRRALQQLEKQRPHATSSCNCPAAVPVPVQCSPVQFIKMFPVSTIRTRSPPLWSIRVSSRTFHTLNKYSHTHSAHITDNNFTLALLNLFVMLCYVCQRGHSTWGTSTFCSFAEFSCCQARYF